MPGYLGRRAQDQAPAEHTQEQWCRQGGCCVCFPVVRLGQVRGLKAMYGMDVASQLPWFTPASALAFLPIGIHM